MKHLEVKYFAVFRDQAGAGSERVATAADTARALFDELKSRHAFTLDAGNVRVAINDEFSDWAAPLSDGDVVVFIPPVAGG